ncbi:sensory neuron membrane protein 2 isoform X2 [Nasonia vitripennis]|uniref:Sensory neuron membrane protein 2 n=1 Tax=Nasonia vitripennis TaxID=7425 RepID=A0A7M7QCH4_NASVI|nr:sensory neuron membrane protein 2 isoform X2 [Nasonia vitripennis]
MSLRICRSVCVAFGFILAGVGLLLGFYVFPLLVNQQVDDTMKLVNGTEAYERWETLPIPLQFKVYFFNVSNPDEVQNGAKPIVKEVGPYVYDEYRHKYDITEDEDGTYSYNQTQLFSFNENASKPNKEDDNIIVAHLPLMAISLIAEKRLMSELLGTVVPHLFDNPKNVFLTTTVKKFLFDGVNINCSNGGGTVRLICNQIRRNAPAQLKVPDKGVDGPFVFSLLSYKNNTHDGRYKVSSGVKDISTLGEIYAWKNSSTVDAWKPNGTCNNIYGTDTTIFPPHRTQLSRVNVFQSDICRTVNLHYNDETEYKNIKGLRFVVEKDMLMSGANYSANKCYCLKETKGINGEDGCLLDGALELYRCQNVPLVLTFPHFYLAHEKYRESVEGLNPDKSKHEIFVELEPKSGTVLRGSKRVQFNIFYRPIHGINLTNKLAHSLMPVFWIDEGVELDDPNINLLYDSLVYPMKILDGVYWTLIGLGLAIGLISMVWCMLFAHKPKHLF